MLFGNYTGNGSFPSKIAFASLSLEAALAGARGAPGFSTPPPGGYGRLPPLR